MFCLIGWLNFILKKWLTISRGAEPHAQNPNSKTEKGEQTNIKNMLCYTSPKVGLFWGRACEAPK